MCPSASRCFPLGPETGSSLGTPCQPLLLRVPSACPGRVRHPSSLCWRHSSRAQQRKRRKLKGGSPALISPRGARGSPTPAGCYGPCLGSRQIHQGKWYQVFFTLFLMAGHFLSLSSIVGKGSERKTEPFFIFLPFAISLRSQKAILQLIFLPPFTRAFCKGTGIPL